MLKRSEKSSENSKQSRAHKHDVIPRSSFNPIVFLFFSRWSTDVAIPSNECRFFFSSPISTANEKGICISARSHRRRFVCIFCHFAPVDKCIVNWFFFRFVALRIAIRGKRHRIDNFLCTFSLTHGSVSPYWIPQYR